MEGLRLDIVTPDKVVLQEEVDYVGASGEDGEFGVMPGHAAMLSALKIGDLYYRKGGVTSWVFVSGGFAQIADNKVTILAEAAELASDIDVDRAEQAKARAAGSTTWKASWTGLMRTSNWWCWPTGPAIRKTWKAGPLPYGAWPSSPVPTT